MESNSDEAAISPTTQNKSKTAGMSFLARSATESVENRPLDTNSSIAEATTNTHHQRPVDNPKPKGEKKDKQLSFFEEQLLGMAREKHNLEMDLLKKQIENENLKQQKLKRKLDNE